MKGSVKKTEFTENDARTVINSSILGGSLGFFGNIYNVVKSLHNKQVFPDKPVHEIRKFRPFIQGGKGMVIGFFAGFVFVNENERLRSQKTRPLGSDIQGLKR